MSLVAGYFSNKGQPLALDLRERLAEYRILPSDAGADFLTDVIQIRFGYLISKYTKRYRHHTPTVADQEGNVLMISGYLFPPGPEDADAYRRLLSLCVETRGKALEACEGEFVGVFAEGRSGTLHVVNDRFGASPFFLLKVGDHTFFASNLAALCFLAGGRRESDVLGWLQIFILDLSLESRTHLRDVSKLLPASHLTLSTDGTRQHQYWRLRHQVDEQADPADMARHVFDAFQRGTERRVRRFGKGIVALSGGLDSRLVAGALPEGADFSAFTFVDAVDTAETLEVRVATEVSELLGLHHIVKPIPQDALSPQNVRDIIALTGGLVAVHHSAKTMQSILLRKELGLDYQMDGGAAALTGGLIPSAEYCDPAKIDRCVRAYQQRIFGVDQVALHRQLFRHDVLREHYPRLVSSWLEAFEAMEGPTAAHRVTALGMARLFAFGLTTCPTHSHPDVTDAHPHLGYEYTDLMLQQPAAWLYKKGFYRFMIFQCLPRLREVVYANTGECLSGDLPDVHSNSSARWREYYSSLRGFASSLRGFAGRALGARVPSLRRGNDFHYTWLRQHDQLLRHAEEILRSQRPLGEILDVEKCTRFVNNCRAGRIQGESGAEDADLLGDLVTMCYAFEFFDSPTIAEWNKTA